jgi:hypothetical protein
MWCEEILVANRSKLVRSTDTIRWRAASSPGDIIRGITVVKSIGPGEEYWDSPCNAADICNPLEVKEQLAAFKVNRLLTTTVNRFHWFGFVETGRTPCLSGR